jgi:hypothetical protein
MHLRSIFCCITLSWWLFTFFWSFHVFKHKSYNLLLKTFCFKENVSLLLIQHNDNIRWMRVPKALSFLHLVPILFQCWILLIQTCRKRRYCKSRTTNLFSTLQPYENTMPLSLHISSATQMDDAEFNVVHVEWVAFLLPIWEIPDSNLGLETDYHDWIFQHVPQNAHANAGRVLVSQIRPRLLPSTFLPVHYSLIILSPIQYKLSY